MLNYQQTMVTITEQTATLCARTEKRDEEGALRLHALKLGAQCLCRVWPLEPRRVESARGRRQPSPPNPNPQATTRTTLHQWSAHTMDCYLLAGL